MDETELNLLPLPANHTVTLDPAGGQVSPMTMEVTAGDVYDLPTPTRTGYNFTGWYLGDTLISNGDSVQITEDSTFTAHWTANTYSVTLDPNGGNVSPMVVEIAAGGAYTLPVPTRTGYTFAGWYLGDAQVSEDSAVQLPPGCTLTAHWQANHYAIWYNPNGGTSDAEGEITIPTKPFLPDRRQLCEYDQDVTLLNCPYTRRGYQFRGWSMDPNADSGYEAGSTVRNLTSEPNGAVILYATWGNTAEIVDPKPGIVCGVMPTTYTAAAPADELVVYTKTYTYDLAGNRTSFTLTRNGWTVQSVTYTYDNLNRLSTVSENGSLQATYTYDANGNRASLTYANGTQEAYTYNKANWITRLENKKGNVVLSSFRYTYYASGSQRSETDHIGKVTRYTYDGLGRLTEESETGGLTVSYTYDQAGNRSQMTVTGSENYTTTYTYDANNRLLTEAKTENGETVTTAYTYDSNGNTLTKVTPAHGEEEASSTVYSYNGFNQLTGLTIDGTTVAYAYNAQGIRTAKRVNHLRTAFLLDGGNVVAEVQNNAVTDNYLRGVNLIRREADSETEYYLFNAHGDVVTTTNPNGTINKSYDYDAFGNEKDPDTLDTNPFRYCGEYLDAETGSYYLRARNYSPITGRFLSEDTYRGDPNDPLTLNLYTYCLNNPLHYIDPTGNAAEDVTRKFMHWLIANPLLTYATQQGWFSELFYLGGFVRDSSCIYHARQDAIQQIGGYNDFYDTVFYYATSMATDKFEFTCAGQEYVFWVWKGDYLNLGAGAELGIYSKQSGLAGKYNIISPLDDHWLVDTSLAMTMTLTLNDSNGNQIFSYSPSEKQWWITGFNPYLQGVQASNLTAIYTVTFNSQAMFHAFYNIYGQGNTKDDRWTFDTETLTATLRF